MILVDPFQLRIFYDLVFASHDCYVQMKPDFAITS